MQQGTGMKEIVQAVKLHLSWWNPLQRIQLPHSALQNLSTELQLLDRKNPVPRKSRWYKTAFALDKNRLEYFPWKTSKCAMKAKNIPRKIFLCTQKTMLSAPQRMLQQTLEYRWNPKHKTFENCWNGKETFFTSKFPVPPSGKLQNFGHYLQAQVIYSTHIRKCLYCHCNLCWQSAWHCKKEREAVDICTDTLLRQSRPPYQLSCYVSELQTSNVILI